MVRGGGLAGGRGNAFEGFEFDENLGGDSVAMRLKDLDLTESRFDGHVDGVSGIGYGEWTMVFQNRANQAKEARCLVRLPHGGRVSRLTLWVDGEPREAAFSSVEKVKAAYREVAVRQQRDPVLVTMAGPDTVMVQCFPVPARGEMKIRFGLTAAVVGGDWELPRIVERNFGLAENAGHALWLQADRRFSVVGDMQVPAPRAEGDGFSVNPVLPVGTVIGGPAVVRLDGGADPAGPLWCEDPFAAETERYLIRRPRDGMRRPIDRLVVVVDGSASLAEHAGWLGSMFAEPGAEMLIADDGVLRGEAVQGYQFTGGRDNEPALREAISLAKEGENGAVVWVHGPQAAELATSATMLQMLERGSRRPKIYEVELVAGPNRMVEALGKADTLERGPTMTDPQTELPGFLKSLRAGGPEPGWEWQRTADVTAVEGNKVWDHLARLWAVERSESDDPQRGKIAAAYQLVTPVSGAVVLETMEQFKAAGLTPVDVAATPSLPTVPEPSTSLLVMIGGAMALARRRRVHDARTPGS